MPIDKARFYRVYSNLPLSERNNVAIVVKGQPLTWSVIYSMLQKNQGNDVLEEMAKAELI